MLQAHAAKAHLALSCPRVLKLSGCRRQLPHPGRACTRMRTERKGAS
eukprot:CAMPEP_0175660500 /NCGR_PEP_ID=MMETSP0097-20121207/14477_1 /TAXON_ID=311494 /ORGANISM="Alexandrium monilatum, Strain CCMP3105" /LENGTH=46 /DNA_ID= /DNA_START= /DNA_END= /DNA_ORIENTATION=